MTFSSIFCRFPPMLFPILFLVFGQSILVVSLDTCPEQSVDCSSFEAIKALHNQLDDDRDGQVDLSESDEFLRDELKYANGDTSKRRKAFHGNDKQITVDELWETWTRSEVHNWTTEEVIDWLTNSVELPQYAQLFRTSAINGSSLPKLAVNSPNIGLRIKDVIHRQKIALKSMDVVLFGLPKIRRNLLKDALLTASILIAVGGCWFGYVQQKRSQAHLKKMLRDMDSLQQAEQRLQKELTHAKSAKEQVDCEKQEIQRLLTTADSGGDLGRESNSTANICDDDRVVRLEDELRAANERLLQTESALQANKWTAPAQLIRLLQTTHDKELKHFNAKRLFAETQLRSAKEGCEKLARKRSTIFGAFRVAHDFSMDDIEKRIMKAKASLSEVTVTFKERLTRWEDIERIMGVRMICAPAKLSTMTNGSHAVLCRSNSDLTSLLESEADELHLGGSAAYQANLRGLQLLNRDLNRSNRELNKSNRDLTKSNRDIFAATKYSSSVFVEGSIDSHEEIETQPHRLFTVGDASTTTVTEVANIHPTVPPQPSDDKTIIEQSTEREITQQGESGEDEIEDIPNPAMANFVENEPPRQMSMDTCSVSSGDTSTKSLKNVANSEQAKKKKKSFGIFSNLRRRKIADTTESA